MNKTLIQRSFFVFQYGQSLLLRSNSGNILFTTLASPFSEQRIQHFSRLFFPSSEQEAWSLMWESPSENFVLRFALGSCRWGCVCLGSLLCVSTGSVRSSLQETKEGEASRSISPAMVHAMLGFSRLGPLAQWLQPVAWLGSRLEQSCSIVG